MGFEEGVYQNLVFPLVAKIVEVTCHKKLKYAKM